MSDIKINVMNGKNPAFSVSMTDEQVRYCTNAANEHGNLVEKNTALRAALERIILANMTDAGGGFLTADEVNLSLKALEQAK